MVKKLDAVKIYEIAESGNTETAQRIWSEIKLTRNWKVFFLLKYEILSIEKCLNHWILGF